MKMLSNVNFLTLLVKNIFTWYINDDKEGITCE